MKKNESRLSKKYLLLLKDMFLPYLCDCILLSQKRLSHGTSMCTSISEILKENAAKNWWTRVTPDNMSDMVSELHVDCT